MSLPKGYKRLEYIQSSGTQYIDTGFKPNNNSRVVVDYQNTNLNTNSGNIFGTDSGWATKAFDLWIHAIVFGTSYVGFSTMTGRVAADLNRGTLIRNGETLAEFTGTFQSEYNLTLFGLNRNGNVIEEITMTLYSCEIFDNGILAREFIPCINEMGVVGLWDNVGLKFYGNAGTGNFVAGPETPKTLVAPENLQVVSGSDTQITLRWDAVEDAAGYKLYRDGILIAALTDTSYTDTIELFSRYTYSLTAYNDEGDSAPAVLDFFAVPEDPVLWLVTDRTQADVEARNEKGIYRAVDLNRVVAVMVYLADRLWRAGHALHTVPKTDWSDADWGCPYTMNRYLQDVATLRSAVRQLSSTPDVPSSMEYVTYAAANDIEKILQALDDALRRMNDTYFYSGELYSGEV